MPTPTRCLPLALVVAFLHTAPAQAVEHVTLSRDGKEIAVSGELVVEAADGGLLLLAPDGMLWTVPPEELVRRTADDTPFEPLGRRELAERLLAGLPAGFEVHETAHYMICYSTSRAYAEWCGGLMERLYLAFTNFWINQRFKLDEPRFPLVALVFADGQAYRDYARPELGDNAGAIIGYYSLQSNRVTMQDLTGLEALRQPGDRRGSRAEINRMLQRPEAERSVATVVHEATHQIAFNCGLQTRYADIPLWLSEGIAVYFEAPDLKSSRGWRGIGDVNQVRLAGFRDYLARRPAGSLKSLLTSDERLRDPRQAGDAYSEAWALVWFLLETRREDFGRYLTLLSQKPPLVWDEPESRLAEFSQFFGADLESLDAALVRRIRGLR